MASLLSREGWLFGLGVGALVLGAVAVWTPGLLSPVASPDSLERDAANVAGTAIGALVLLALGLVTATARTRADPPAPPTPVEGTESAQPGGRAEQFDEQLRAVLEDDRRNHRPAIQGQLERVAVSTVVSVDDCSRATAEAAVTEGTWTGDPVAAALLAGEDGPGLPLGWRLYGWIFPETAYRQAVERTVRAIETYGRGERA